MRKKLSYLVLILISLTLQLSAMTLELPYSVTDSITNPSFEDGLNGWTNPDDFVIQTNNAFAQKEGVNYVEKWQSSGSWTNVKLSQTLSNMPIGYYKLSAAAINNPSTTGGAYIYANNDSTEVFENIDYDVYFQTSNSSFEIGFNVISGGNYIGTDNYRLDYLGADDYKAYLRMYVDSAQTMIANPVDLGDAAPYTNLQLYVDSTQAVIDNANATIDEVIEVEGLLKAAIALVYEAMQLPNRIASWTALPYDATEILTNPSFETNSTTGWTTSMAFKINSNTGPFNKEGTYYTEIWQGSATGGWSNVNIHQVVDYIPNGSYLITAVAQAIDQSNNTYPGNSFIYANDDSTEVFAGNSYSVLTEVTDNTLELGFCITDESGNWIALDNFQVKYLGNGDPVLVVSESELTFDGATQANTFDVSGFSLSDGISITAPEGFSLDIDSIGIIDGIANQSTITVSITDTTVIEGLITITSDSISKEITIIKGTKELFIPEAETAYYISQKGSGMILGNNIDASGIFDFDANNTSLLMTFVESATEGQYFIKSADAKFLYCSSANTWSMGFTSDTAGIANDCLFEFKSADNGYQQIDAVRNTASQVVGSDATADGSGIYYNKSANDDKRTWQILKPSSEYTFEVSDSLLTFDDVRTTATFTVSGNDSLMQDIKITAPSGFSVDMSSVPAAAEETTITVTFDASAEVNGTITVTSSGISKEIGVVGFLNATNFTPLYNSGNLISDPYISSLDAFGGWGHRTVTTDTAQVYSGSSSYYCDGQALCWPDGASFDYGITGMESDTYYRLRFMVKTVDGSFTINTNGCYVNGNKENIYTIDTENEWNLFDKQFLTGTLTGGQNLYFNNCEGATGMKAYLDNYELYKMPMAVSTHTLTFIAAGDKSFDLIAQSLTEQVMITAPAGFAINLDSLGADTTSTPITVTFDGLADASGYIVITSGDYMDSVFVEGTVAATLVISESYLTFDDMNTMATFIVSGGNLSEDISITAPTGFSVDKATASMDSTETTVTVTFDASAALRGDISIMSSGISEIVRVIGFIDSYTPLYPEGTNLNVDPYMTDLSNFGGWGTTSIIKDTAIVYSGISSASINGGSIDCMVTLSPSSYYRVRAMIKAATNGCQLGYFGSTEGDKNFKVDSTTVGMWAPLDFTFMTGDASTLDGKSTGIFFNGSDGSFIDNWEIFKIPMYLAEDTLEMMTTVDSFMVAIQDLTSDVTVTAPAGFSVDQPSISATAAMVSVVVTFDNTMDASGYIYLTSGNTVDSIYVSAKVASAIAEQAAPAPFSVYVSNGKINVNFELAKNAHIQFAIYTMQGALVANEQSSFTTGMQNTILKAELASGVYLVNIVKDGKAITYKVVK